MLLEPHGPGKQDVTFEVDVAMQVALETGQSLSITRHPIRQYLERDIPTELRIAGAIHFAHPACAKKDNDFVRADPGAGSKCHGSGMDYRDGIP